MHHKYKSFIPTNPALLQTKMEDVLFEEPSNFEFEPRHENHYAGPFPYNYGYGFSVTHLFITGLLSTNAVGPGRIWTADTTTQLGSVSLDLSELETGAYGEIYRVSRACCWACTNEFPSTLMFNYEKESSGCQCLKATPEKTPATKAPYTLGKCQYQTSPGTPLGLIVSESVAMNGEVAGVANSERCCEECEKVHNGTELFAYINTDEDTSNSFKMLHDQSCMCYTKKQEVKPVTIPSNFYAGVCGTRFRKDCKTTPPRPDKNGNLSKGNQTCLFPFKFNGVIYYSCAPGHVASNMPEDSFWCSTQYDGYGGYVKDQWGYCGEGCP